MWKACGQSSHCSTGLGGHWHETPAGYGCRFEVISCCILSLDIFISNTNNISVYIYTAQIQGSTPLRSFQHVARWPWAIWERFTRSSMSLWSSADAKNKHTSDSRPLVNPFFFPQQLSNQNKLTIPTSLLWFLHQMVHLIEVQVEHYLLILGRMKRSSRWSHSASTDLSSKTRKSTFRQGPNVEKKTHTFVIIHDIVIIYIYL